MLKPIFFEPSGQDLMVNPHTWEIIVWQRDPFRLWFQTYPQSEMHGGGPPHRESFSEKEISTKLMGSEGWTAPNVNVAVEYLIDRWCERRQLLPLRFVLQGWPHNGLTDGVAELRDALEAARSFARDAISEFEKVILTATIENVNRALTR